MLSAQIYWAFSYHVRPGNTGIILNGGYKYWIHVQISTVDKLRREIARMNSEVDRLEKEVARQKGLR